MGRSYPCKVRDSGKDPYRPKRNYHHDRTTHYLRKPRGIDRKGILARLRKAPGRFKQRQGDLKPIQVDLKAD